MIAVILAAWLEIVVHGWPPAQVHYHPTAHPIQTAEVLP